MDKQLDRAKGALVGLAVGDALGAPIEFSPRDSLPHVTGYQAGGPHKLKAGQFTDDGTQALCLAESLIESEGVFDPADFLERVAASYRTGHNYVTGRCFDIGNQTVRAIEAFETAGSCRNNVDEDAQGNGALMRLAPAVLVGRTELDAVVVATVGIGVEKGVWRTPDAAGVTQRRSAALRADRAWPDRTSVASRA